MKKNIIEKNILKQCDLCARPILVNRQNSGACEHCGWMNFEAAVINDDRILLPNFVSFKRAKELHVQGKALKPSFNEFIQVLYEYDEMEFVHNGTVYGVIRGEAETGNKIELFIVGVKDSSKFYKDYNDFRQNAEINSLLLSKVWDEVTDVNFLQ
ncbi:MAG: hypothetical protein FWE53_01285 [Firmicutes bacterium]|nr:hypothetical protein [Bacillota bacterium]